MGFKVKGEKDKNSLEYSQGEPVTIKGNMKDGVFQHLSSTIGQKELKIAMLKDVSLKGVILYPFNENNMSERNWRQIFYVNLETQEVSATLIKTYNLAEFDRLNRELQFASRQEKTELDYTEVEINCSIESAVFSGEQRNIIKFYFCKSKKTGNSCHYVNDDGSINEDAEINFLDKDQYKKNEKFFKANFDNLFDYRLTEEIAVRNFPEASKMSSKELKEFRVYLLFNFGYISEQAAIELINQRNNMSEGVKLMLKNA